VQRKRLEDGSDVQKFRTLLASLSTIVRNTCRRRGAGTDEATFLLVTIANVEQRRALDRLETIPSYPGR